MVGSMFAAISGLKAHQTRMDVIGNNIANVNTWGYKSQSANFMDATYRTRTLGKEGAAAVGGTNAAQVGYGANVGSISINFATGNWNPTGLDSDCMIDGSAFFVVSPTGAAPADIAALASTDGVYLSRVGIMNLDSNGFLVDDMGSFILDTAGKRIQGETDITYTSLKIHADGSISGIRGNGANKGKEYDFAGVKIGLAVVQNPSGLEKTQGYYLAIGPNAGTVALVEQGTETGEIKSGYLEMSNTDLSNEMALMITTQRGYQANTKIITVTDEMLEQLVNMKR